MRLCYLATVLLDRGDSGESVTRRRDDMWHYANRDTAPTGVLVPRYPGRLEAGRASGWPVAVRYARRGPLQRFCGRLV